MINKHKKTGQDGTERIISGRHESMHAHTYTVQFNEARLTKAGTLTVVMRSTAGSPADFSGTNTKVLGVKAATLVPFSTNVTFSLGRYSLVMKRVGNYLEAPKGRNVFCNVLERHKEPNHTRHLKYFLINLVNMDRFVCKYKSICMFSTGYFIPKSATRKQ